MKAVFLILFLLIACSQPVQQQTLPPIQGPPPTGLTTTQDGQTIAYDYYPNAGKPAIILLHMLRRDRTDWKTIAEWLQQSGYAVIVPDLRGHGQSTGNWEQFTANDFNAMTYDAAAMKSVMENTGADTTKLTIIGASIGANVAYNYAVNDNDVKTIILLSPGLDYRGILLNEKKYTKPYLVVASNDDDYSAQTAKDMKKQNPVTELKLYTDAGHGTNMFAKNDLAPTMLNWIQRHNY